MKNDDILPALFVGGYENAVIIDYSVESTDSSKIDRGVFVEGKSVINCGSVIQRFSIINTGTVIEYDCSIGDE